MSKSLSAGMITAIADGSAKLVRIWDIVRPDAGVRRFTDFDQNIVYGGNTYYADSTVDITSISTSMAGGSQSADLNVVFGDTANTITYADAEGGLYDFSSITVTAIDASTPATVGMVLLSGTLGAFQMDDNYSGSCEVNGLLQTGTNKLTEKYSPECPANLGDARCGIAIASFTTTGTVDTVASNRKFEATFADNEANDYYAFGILTWTSGNNNGASMEVLTHFQVTTEDDITMAFSFPKAIQVGDTFTLTAGCDKRPTTCINKFANIANFRGFPFIPPEDKLKDLPTTNITSSPQGGL